VRKCLQRAGILINSGNADDAMFAISEAFARLLSAYGVASSSAREVQKGAKEIDQAISRDTL